MSDALKRATANTFRNIPQDEQMAYVDDYLSKNTESVPFSAYEIFVTKNNKVVVRETVTDIMKRFYFASHPNSAYVLLQDRMTHRNISGFAFLRRKQFPKLCRALTLAAIKLQLPEDDS